MQGHAAFDSLRLSEGVQEDNPHILTHPTFDDFIVTVCKKLGILCVASGILSGTMPLAVKIDGVAVATVTLTMITGYDKIFGTNEATKTDDTYRSTQFLKFTAAWDQNTENQFASVATDVETTVTLKAYLKTDESYIISDMTTTRHIGTLNPNRDDCLDMVSVFSAPADGVYDITIMVTESAYLPDDANRFGAQYTSNNPASAPITTLRSIKILHD